MAVGQERDAICSEARRAGRQEDVIRGYLYIPHPHRIKKLFLRSETVQKLRKSRKALPNKFYGKNRCCTVTDLF